MPKAKGKPRRAFKARATKPAYRKPSAARMDERERLAAIEERLAQLETLISIFNEQRLTLFKPSEDSEK